MDRFEAFDEFPDRMLICSLAANRSKAVQHGCLRLFQVWRLQNEAVRRRFGTVAVAAYSASNPFVAVYSVRGGVRRGRGTGATEWISMRVTVSHNRRKEEV